MNIKEIAKLAGVSVASVSRAFNDGGAPSKLSEKQRRHILAICEKHHYCPDIHSQRMNMRHSNCVALMSHYFVKPVELPHPSIPFDYNFASTMMGVQSILQNSDKSLQLVQITEKFIRKRNHISMLRSKMFDAVMIWGALYSDDFVREMLREKVPVLLLATELPDCPCSQIIADDYGGIRSIIRDVLDAGHRRLALIVPEEMASSGLSRKRAMLETLAESGLEPVWCSESPIAFTYQGGYEAAERILREAPEVTCIVAPNDASACGVIMALCDRHISIPEQISVTGGDGVAFFGQFKLDSFYLPSYEIGETAARTALRLIEGEELTSRQILPVTRVYGNSIKKLNE